MRLGKQSNNIALHYTVVCFFVEKDLQKIVRLIEKLKLVDSKQYFYSPGELHMTILGGIDINSDESVLIKVVQDFLDNNKITFHLLGVGSKVDPRSVTAYPVGFQISKVRSKKGA